MILTRPAFLGVCVALGSRSLSVDLIVLAATSLVFCSTLPGHVLYHLVDPLL